MKITITSTPKGYLLENAKNDSPSSAGSARRYATLSALLRSIVRIFGDGRHLDG